MSNGISIEDALEMMKETRDQHLQYPQGDEAPVAVTLSDEQWNAVTLALKLIVIAENVKDRGILPGWIVDQMMESAQTITDQVFDVIKHLAQHEMRNNDDEL